MHTEGLTPVVSQTSLSCPWPRLQYTTTAAYRTVVDVAESHRPRMCNATSSHATKGGCRMQSAAGLPGSRGGYSTRCWAQCGTNRCCSGPGRVLQELRLVWLASPEGLACEKAGGRLTSREDLSVKGNPVTQATCCSPQHCHATKCGVVGLGVSKAAPGKCDVIDHNTTCLDKKPHVDT